MPEPPAEFRDDLRRSIRLFRSFRSEQGDPDSFYTLIADDAVAMVGRHADLEGKLVADFGGGPGYYSRAFRSAGAHTILVDADFDEITLRGARPPGAVVGLAQQSPLRDESVDVAFSSNLLEHVHDFEGTCDQLVRVVRPGGLAVLSYTLWWGPWGGHETSPWHYLGGGRAAERYTRRHGHRPKNDYGVTMFAAHARDGLRWATDRPDLQLLERRPRYWPARSTWLLSLPGVRELVSWNLWLVVRKGEAGRHDSVATHW